MTYILKDRKKHINRQNSQSYRAIIQRRYRQKLKESVGDEKYDKMVDDANRMRLTKKKDLGELFYIDDLYLLVEEDKEIFGN